MKHINTFEGGMRKDYNENFTQANTYLESLNGRLIFNEDNNTLAWEFANGTKAVFTLNANEEIVGSCELNNRLVLLTTNGITSRILGIEEDKFGTHSLIELFNDDYDPYGDRLNLRNRCEIHSIMENSNIERIYWNDDRNEPRVFNILNLGLWNVLISPPYPNYYSVHSMSRMMDLFWGNIRYDSNISGNLLVGKRQYFYRYIHHNGYTSPWSPISEAIFVTSDEINKDNWNEYEMESSGTVTKKGHKLLFKDLDTRFEKMEVGCVLWYTDEAPDRAYIFQKVDITSSNVTINHISDVGTPILLEEINQRYFDVQHAKAQNIKNKTLHEGNLVMRPQPIISNQIMESIVVEPVIRKMLSDTTKTKKEIPLTHQTPFTATITKQVFGSVTETLNVKDDYINYKGTQWEHSFKSHFRGGMYPFSLVLYDRKGQPCFAQYIGDFKFPEQYSNQWELRRPSGTITGTTGSPFDYTLTEYNLANAGDIIVSGVTQSDNHVIKILGAKFSNIDLTDVLYDTNGKIQLSGFSIVRSDRVPDIICQGLLMNATVEINNEDGTGVGYERNIPKVQPLHSSGNYYCTKYNVPNVTKPFYGLEGTVLTGSGNYPYTPSASIPDHGENASGGFFTAQNIFTFEAPDFMMNNNIINTKSAEKFKIVGNCQLSYNSPKFGNLPIDPNYSYATSFNGNLKQFNTKHYATHTDNLYWLNDLDGLAPIGVGNIMPFNSWGVERQAKDIKCPVHKEEYLSIGDGYYLISNWETFLLGFGNMSSRYTTPAAVDNQARGHQSSMYVNAPFGNLSSYYTPWIDPSDMTTNRSCYFIANYRTGLDGYVLDDNIVKNRIYKNIGHFIPINNTTITQATQLNGRVVFNDVEVWGGDCFVDYFDYCRLTPLYEEDPANAKDYALGLIFPTESQYNFTMKKGNRYARVGSRSQQVDMGISLGNDNNSLMQDGIFQSRVSDYYRLEDFDVNRCLQTPDENRSVNKYFVRNIDEKIDFPLMYIHSEEKFLGEIYDNFRKFKVNNFDFVDGKYGSITKIVDLFDNNYIIQEGALSKMRFKERTMIQSDQKQLTVGNGQGYDEQDYIHTDYGSQHQWSIVYNGRSIYGIDAHKGKQWRFGQDGFNIISDVSGLHNFFTENTKYYWKKPYVGLDTYERYFNEGNFDDARLWGGIHSVYDFKNNSLITTFSNRYGLVKDINGVSVEEKTIEYSETNNTYTTLFSFKPYIYLGLKRNYYSPDLRILYQHDEGFPLDFYGVLQNSYLEYIVSPNGVTHKTFDNKRLNINALGVPTLLTWTGVTDENNVHTISFATDTRQKYREGFMTFPTRELFKQERLRGKYCKNRFTFSKFARDNDKAIIPISESEIRISNRF